MELGSFPPILAHSQPFRPWLIRVFVAVNLSIDLNVDVVLDEKAFHRNYNFIFGTT